MRFSDIRSGSIMGLSALILSAASPVIAAPMHFAGRAPDFHGRVESFGPHDRDMWRRGHWVHDRHGSSFGWWRVVDGGWFFYPAPVYPYPVYPYPYPVYADPDAVLQPPPTAEAQPQSWYYCSNPKGYYPYVASCTTAWTEVPSTPPSPPAPPPPG